MRRRRWKRRRRRKGAAECGCLWPAAASQNPSYLDELLKLLNMGLQLGLLNAQFLPAQVQGFHSALKCLEVGKWRGQEGSDLGTEEGPSIPAPVPLCPGLPLFTPPLVQSRASQDTGTRKA